jgi:RNA-directed DNA polymerase
MSMHADERSDEGVVPEKRPNKGGLPPVEAVEGRTSPKGNGGQTAAVRTQGRAAASNGLAAVRQAARQNKEVRFTALLHHLTLPPLRRQNPREEPGALAAHAGICTGGAGQPASLP